MNTFSVRKFWQTVVGFAFVIVSIFPSTVARAGSEEVVIRDILFPVEGAVTYYDDFGEPRWEHSHEGIDIKGKKMQKLLAAVDGRVSYIVDPEASWGYAIVLRDDEGYTYHYLHVNNDTPGTDDGNGGFFNAYASGMYEGARVVRGQHVAWMGDSGNAEAAGAHLHFEIRKNGTPINPYPSLVRAQSPLENGSQTGQAGGGGGVSGSTFDPAAAKAASPTINADKGLSTVPGVSYCEPDALIKSLTSTAVYYCGEDGRRYVFPNDKVYFSWYSDFNEIKTISETNLAQIRLGGNVTYRPGVKLIEGAGSFSRSIKPVIHGIMEGEKVSTLTTQPSPYAKTKTNIKAESTMGSRSVTPFQGIPHGHQIPLPDTEWQTGEQI